MKRKFTPFITAVAAAGMVFASAMVIAQTDSKNAKDDAKKAFFTSLQLTDEQRAQMRELMPKRGKQKPTRAMRALIPLAFTDELDETQIALSLDAMIAKSKATGLAMAERRFQVRQILTDEQLAQLEEKQANRQTREKQTRDPAKVAEKLALSEEQTTAFVAAAEAVQTDRENLKSLMKTFKTTERDLIEGETFDSDTWLAQFDLHAVEMRTASNQLISSLHTMYNVLDADQQSKFKRLMKRSSKGKQKRG